MLTARVTGANGTSGSRVPGPGSGDLASAIERLPRLSLTEMKPGETVLLAGSYGDDPARVTVITLLAGAEPILQSRSGRALDLGSWNLDLNMSAGVP